MKTTTTFHCSKEEKEKLSLEAKKESMSLSTFCRYNLLKLLKENRGVKQDDE